MASGNFFKHWPTMLLGLIVAVILLTAVFSFQLNQTEVAVVTTFGRPAVVDAPGLHFRWPFPFQEVYRFDKRIRCYEGSSGKLEETVTKDGHNIIVGIYVNYRISDVNAFFSKLKDVANAEDVLNTLMRSAKNSAFGQRNFDQIVNDNGKMLKLDELMAAIKGSLEKDTSDFGIDIVGVGINNLGVPKTVSEKVFERMIAERKQFADKNLAEGKREAKEIRVRADLERDNVIANAEAKAQKLRAEGDAEAAKFYKEFAKDPELAEFLRKTDALRSIMKNRTTLILDTNVPPFDLLKPGAVVPGAGSAAPAAKNAK
ncbi:MAG: protease modulator HflC [Lentisphaeria bacterium]|nr:protease modulator HflC [Lentisphaeria bacterium]MBR7131822.1 protease modulator HflC [Lentisphaeria bacterium]